MSQQQQQRQMMDAYEDATKLVTGSSHLTIPDGFKAYEIASNGISYIDVLPYVASNNPKVAPGSWTWHRSYNVHRNMGLDGRTSVVCPRDMGQPCPICEAGANLARRFGTSDKQVEKAIKGLEAKQRTLFVVFDLDRPDDGIQILDVSHFLFTKLLGTRISKANVNDKFEAGWRYFADPENGMSLKITWTSESFESRPFWKAASIDFRPREQQYDGAQLVEMTPCLDDCLNVMSYEEIARVLGETPNDLLAHNADGAPMATNMPQGTGGTLPPRRLPGKAAAPAAAAPVATARPAAPAARPAAAPAKAVARPAAAKAAPAPEPVAEEAWDETALAEDQQYDEALVPADDEQALLEGEEVAYEEAVDEIPFEEPAPESPPVAPPARVAAKAAPRPAARPAAAPVAAPAATTAPARPAAVARPAAAPARPAAPAAAPARPAAPAAAPTAAKAAPRPAKAAPRPAATAPAAPAADADFGWPE